MQKEVTTTLFKFLGFIIGPLSIVLFVVSVVSMLKQNFTLKEMIANNDVCVVEGVVENFNPMPHGGHDTENFEIDGVYFEYANNILANGYNKSSYLGGVVTGNGQHLKIKYVTSEFYDVQENLILYIAEIE